MTEEELKAKEINDKKIKDQNAYITKLENERIEAKKQLEAATKDNTDPSVVEYVRQSRMKEFKSLAEKELRVVYGDAVVDAVKPDYDLWCESNADADIANLQFFKSAFQMTLGTAISNTEHAVREAIGIPKVKVEPKVDPLLKKVTDQVLPPNPLNNNDRRSADPGFTPEEGSTPNTDAAMNAFKIRLAKGETTSYD